MVDGACIQGKGEGERERGGLNNAPTTPQLSKGCGQRVVVWGVKGDNAPALPSISPIGSEPFLSLPDIAAAAVALSY
jgi:hypothetical protein